VFCVFLIAICNCVEQAGTVPQKQVFPHFMQPKSPLVCSQQFAPSPYPMTQVHTLPTYVLKIHYNILHPCLGLPKSSFNLSHQNPAYISSSPDSKLSGKQYSEVISTFMEIW